MEDRIPYYIKAFFVALGLGLGGLLLFFAGGIVIGIIKLIIDNWSEINKFLTHGLWTWFAEKPWRLSFPGFIVLTLGLTNIWHIKEAKRIKIEREAKANG